MVVKEFPKHQKTSLFLMELLFSLLILALSGAACIQIFSLAYEWRNEARQENHIQQLASNAAQILSATDGTAQSFLEVMENGRAEDTALVYDYDKTWNPCSQEEAVYTMNIELDHGEYEKAAAISFYDREKQLLYELTVRFPISRVLGKEAAS